jgi:hypothetical protein
MRMTFRLFDHARSTARTVAPLQGALLAILLTCVACRDDAAGDTLSDAATGDGNVGAGCCFYSCESPSGSNYHANTTTVDEVSCSQLAADICTNDATDSTTGNSEFAFGCNCMDACAPSWWPSS